MMAFVSGAVERMELILPGYDPRSSTLASHSGAISSGVLSRHE